jgi:hypothetical protein
VADFVGFPEKVVKNIPCYELRFKADKRVEEFIQKAMRI